MAHNNTTSSSINHDDQTKVEVLRMFDNIDGELNLISSNEIVNSEVPIGTADFVTEIELESELKEKSIDDVNCNLTNGKIGFILDNKSNNKNNSLIKDVLYQDGAVDQNYNLTFTEEKKDLMASTGETTESNMGSENALNFRKKLVKRYGSELNNSQINEETSTNTNESADNMILVISSDDSSDSDTDEVDNRSSSSVINAANDKNEEISQRAELHSDKQHDSVLESVKVDEANDKGLHEIAHESMVISDNEDNKKSNSNQTSMLKFLVPQQPLMKESPGNKNSATTCISLSRLIINSCTDCDLGYKTVGIKLRKCKGCGKHMKFNCFICNELHNTSNGICSHILKFHQFSWNLFNTKVYMFMKSYCSKCKEVFDAFENNSVCPNCNKKLGFGCQLCDEWSKTRSEVLMHVAKYHTKEFVTSQKTSKSKPRGRARQNLQNLAKINKRKGRSKDNEDQNKKDASLIEESTTGSRKNSGAKQLYLNKRKVRFQMDNAESDSENEIENISESEAAEILGPSNSVKRQSINTKIDTSIETPTKPKNKSSNKLSGSKQNVSNRRRSSNNVNLNSSASKNSTEVISNNENMTETPTAPKSMAGRLRSSKINLNSSDVNVSEAFNSSSLPIQTSSSATKISGRRRSAQVKMQNNMNIDDDIPLKVSVDIPNKRRSIRTASTISETSSPLEYSNIDITSSPKAFASKPSTSQGKRRSSKAVLDTTEANIQGENVSLGTDITPKMIATEQQGTNKRRKSEKTTNATIDDSCSEISVDQSNIGSSDDPDLWHCSFCQKTFVDQRSLKKHQHYCNKEPSFFCDYCSYSTKHISNLRKHERIAHGPPKDPETAQVQTLRLSLNRSVGYGTICTADSSCTAILNNIGAHCPQCTDEVKMKPNDANCRKCNMKLELTCLKCRKIFAEFLSIFNHLYIECAEKQYLCNHCDFTTIALDAIQTHMYEEHSDMFSNSGVSEKSSESPFALAAQRKSTATSSDAKTILKIGYKTRAGSSIKPKEKSATDGATTVENESSLKKCPKCNLKVPSLMKHLNVCKAQLRCPFCVYASKTKHMLKKHLIMCHTTKSHNIKFQEFFKDNRIKRNADGPDAEEMMGSYCKDCDNLIESKPYKFKCENCQKDLEYQCLKCNVKFKTREMLRKHAWAHIKTTDGNYLSCTSCSKKFAFIENLRMHEKVCNSALQNTTV